MESLGENQKHSGSKVFETKMLCLDMSRVAPLLQPRRTLSHQQGVDVRHGGQQIAFRSLLSVKRGSRRLEVWVTEGSLWSSHRLETEFAKGNRYPRD